MPNGPIWSRADQGWIRRPSGVWGLATNPRNQLGTRHFDQRDSSRAGLVQSRVALGSLYACVWHMAHTFWPVVCHLRKSLYVAEVCAKLSDFVHNLAHTVPRKQTFLNHATVFERQGRARKC